jgi:hypothetical protein
MARMPFRTWFLVAFLAIEAQATQVFKIVSNASSGASKTVVNTQNLPFDHVEIEMESLTHPRRNIEVKLWKDSVSFRPNAKFRLLPLDPDDGRMILLYREKNEEILIALDPALNRVLQVQFQHEESIGEWALAAWNWFRDLTARPTAVALADAKTRSVVANADPAARLAQDR